MKLPPGHVAGQGVSKPVCTVGFGERMLRGMGWDSGQGLGKEGTGIREAIQVKKKEDTVGVGGNGCYDWGNKWWEKAFDSAAQTVGDSGSSSNSSDSDSDDEHMAAIVAAVNRDGTRTSASADELRLLASLSRGGSRVAAGRFGGRDAKMARIRQQEATMAAAAEAKLGMTSAPSGAAAAVSAGTTAATTGVAGTNGTAGLAQEGSQRSDTTSEAKLSEKKKKKRKGGSEGEQSPGSGSSKRKKGSKAAAADGKAALEQQQQQQEVTVKKQRIVIEPVIAHTSSNWQFVPTPSTGWWGASRFASAGCLEGLDKAAAEAQRQRMTFDEDTQARIFTTAHATKTQGKVGLGKGTRGSIKVGGVKWEGKRKVSFEEEGEEEAVGQAAAGDEASAPSGTVAMQATGSCTNLEAKEKESLGKAAAEAGKQRGGAQQQQNKAAAAPVAGWEDAVKWRKVIAAQLRPAEQQQLKLKELQRQVVAVVRAKHGHLVSCKAAIKSALSSRLECSSQFVVEGKHVRLHK